MKHLPRINTPFRVFLLLTLPAVVWLGAKRIFEPSAEERIDKARELASAGDLDGAEAQLERVISVDPINARALLDRGRLAQRKGEVYEAIHWWLQVPSSSRFLGAEAKCKAAREFHRLGLLRQAEETYLEALACDRRVFPAIEGLHEVYLDRGLGDDNRTRLMFLRIYRPWRDGEVSEYLLAGAPRRRTPAEVERLRGALVADPTDTQTRLALARHYRESGAFKEAIGMLADRRRIEDSSSCLTELAQAYADASEWPRAVEVLETVARRFRAIHCSFFLSCAAVAENKGDLDEFALCLDTALKLPTADLSRRLSVERRLEALDMRRGRAEFANRRRARIDNLEQVVALIPHLGRVEPPGPALESILERLIAGDAIHEALAIVEHMKRFRSDLGPKLRATESALSREVSDRSRIQRNPPAEVAALLARYGRGRSF
jgi:tetratricopeptide (TPR) repeat protein